VKRIVTALLLSLAAWPAGAQETRPLTENATAAIMAFYNHPQTTRLRGETRIAPGSRLEGNVAALGGTLTVAGQLLGDLVVINGDLRLLPGARVDGAATVVGGRVEGDTTTVTGGIIVYHETFRFRREGDRMVAPVTPRPGWPSPGRRTWFGRTDLIIGLDGSYNRVEGLPIMAGPRIELGHSNPTVLDGRVVYLTRSGLRLHHDDLGYDLRLEQYLGGRRGMAVGVGVLDRVQPIEPGGLSNTENSLATFILHKDYRDHYARRGWSAYLRFIGTTRPYEVLVTYRDENHRSIDTGTPWSLLRNDSPWRPQPQVAPGTLRSLHGSFTWDSRNDPDDPAAGWLVTAGVEQGLGGSLAVPWTRPDQDPDAPADLVADAAEFTHAAVDARRYLRIGPRSRLAVRAMAAGATDAGPLPPQRQHALGGEGNLPGHPLFRFDCGARAQGPADDGFFPYYGCDRVLLFQAEYRFALLTDPGIARRLGLDFDLFATPELVLFANAGRAWIEARGLGDRNDVGPGSLRPDVGGGLRMGPIGLYLAAPLAGRGGPNFFVRLGPRF
jgi:hypothetical protein